jgi:hypothetical protein
MPAPRGLPSSSVQLRTLYIKSALVAHLEITQLLKGRIFVDNQQIANLKAELKLPPKVSAYSMIVF